VTSKKSSQFGRHVISKTNAFHCLDFQVSEGFIDFVRI